MNFTTEIDESELTKFGRVKLRLSKNSEWNAAKDEYYLRFGEGYTGGWEVHMSSGDNSAKLELGGIEKVTFGIHSDIEFIIKFMSLVKVVTKIVDEVKN